MLKFTYPEPDLTGDKAERTLQQANQVLLDVVGPTRVEATAEWRRTTDAKGNDRFSLRITDSTSEVREDFTPDQLQNMNYLRSQFTWRWGDLLQARSHKLLEEMMKTE